jgi:hypothetical protein
VLSKVAVLTPVLALVAATLLGVLRVPDRLPALGWETYAALFVTLLVESVAALALGLLASAAVADAAQATLALPMLCFPQVLFAGGHRAGRRDGSARPADQLWHGQPLGLRVVGPSAAPRRRSPRHNGHGLCRCVRGFGSHRLGGACRVGGGAHLATMWVLHRK